ncbi:calcium-binding protein [Streptomyces turgidiscabies]|uniref:Calcium-binding protein n=1 Tax=Streptomyces turgidiscabies TaxID=85558 RepID=A0ABU0RSZ1_9ACTN|nr:calcium-binding protein [Streptomyces turgidiscabies]MDQ0935112.1 hypothetical protein [Streptomyces turgidiscabies]
MPAGTRRVLAALAASTALALSGALTAAPVYAAPTADDIRIDSFVVNGGKPVVVGTKGVVKFPLSLTATHASGVYQAFAYLFGSYAFLDEDQHQLDCAGTKPTTTCTGTYTLDPVKEFYQDNSPAGVWEVRVHVDAWETSYDNRGDYTFKVLRASKLTANATPEPVKKGRTITVKGTLTHADWSVDKYVGVKNRSVKLQFRKKGGTGYTTVKTVRTGKGGAVTATTTAGSDGYYRFVYGGTGTTAAVTSSGDFIDVQ